MNHLSQSYMDTPATFRVRVQGTPSHEWVKEMFGDVAVVTDEAAGGAQTEVVGEMVDQAALLGLINAFYNYGYAVISVERLDMADAEAPAVS